MCVCLTFAEAPPSAPPSQFLLERQRERDWSDVTNRTHRPGKISPISILPPQTPLSHPLLPTFAVDGGERPARAGLQGGRGDGEAWGHGEAGGGQPQGHIAPREELVRLELCHCWPLGGLCVQHALDQGGRHRVDVLEGGGRTEEGGRKG